MSSALAWWCVLAVAGWRWRPAPTRRERPVRVQPPQRGLRLPRVRRRTRRLSVPAITRRRGRRPAEHRLTADLVSITDLIRVAVATGQRPPDAIATVCRHLTPERRAGLDVVGSRLRAGHAFDEAVAGWGDDLGPPATELAQLLISASRSGSALGPALDRLAADLRGRRRRRSQARARRLPVLMLLPLVACVLPAFVLLTVVPMLAVGLDGLVLGPP